MDLGGVRGGVPPTSYAAIIDLAAAVGRVPDTGGKDLSRLAVRLMRDGVPIEERRRILKAASDSPAFLTTELEKRR